MPSYTNEKENLKGSLTKFFDTPQGKKPIDDFISGKTKNILINLNDLTAFQSVIAQDLIEHASNWGLAALELAVTEYVNFQIDPLIVSITGTLPLTLVHDIGAKDIGKIIKVHGLVNKTAPIHPMYVECVFKCIMCGTESPPIIQENPWLLTKPMPKCDKCDDRTTWEPIPQLSKLEDSQEFTIQESYEDIASNKIPRPMRCITFKKHIMNFVNCGDDIEAICVVNAMSASQKFQKTKFNVIYVEVLDVIKRRKDPESIVFTPEEEVQFKEIAADPDVYTKMINSLAPSLCGHENEKEAVLLAIFGSPEEVKEDITIRGNIHILMVGDPACISGDSRVALYNGIMPQIETLGKNHLEKIDISVFSAKGNGRFGNANEFHIYDNQQVYEMITESGRRLIGTYNQTLQKKDGFNSQWKRMDELNIGDEIRVVTKIPCYIKTSPISKSLAALFGYRMADGYKSKYRIGFVVNNEERDLIPQIQENLMKEFGRYARTYHRMTSKFGGRLGCKTHIPKPISYLELNSKDASLKFNEEIDTLFKSSNDVVSVALSWLFDGDGHVLNKGRGKNGVFLKQGDNKDVQFMRDIQLLLLRFGIYSIIDKDTDGTKWLKIRQSNSIIRYAKYIGFNSLKKKEKLEKLLSILPLRKFHNKLWEHIKVIRPFGYTKVYDIHEPKYHQFVANGIVVHNTAKSQLLRSAVELSPRGMYAMGRGTTAAGLTAALHRDTDSGEWEISAGVLVLADEGVAAIDEIDKMKDEDRVNIHEAMEQQTVSIDKAGYHIQMKARTAVIAAANPSLGRYDVHKSVFENLPKFPPSLFSRFDLIFKVLDIPDEETDMKVVTHIMETCVRKSPIDRKVLRKYIGYAKRIKPTLSKEAVESLKNYFVAVRKTYTSDNKVLPFSFRQFEALKRLTLARARALLKPEAEVADVDAVKRLFDVFLKDTLGGDVSQQETGIATNQASLMNQMLEAFKNHNMSEKELRNYVKCDDDMAFRKAFTKLRSGNMIRTTGSSLYGEEVFGLMSG